MPLSLHLIQAFIGQLGGFRIAGEEADHVFQGFTGFIPLFQLIETVTQFERSIRRFIATLGTQVVEVGPVNATIHQIDERILASDLDLLTEVYYQTLVHLLAC